MVLTNLVGCVKVDIMNLRKVKPSEPYDFRIDRPSPLENKFPLLDESNRDNCIDHFEKYFPRLLKQKDVQILIRRMIVAHQEHGQVRLFCWCAPKRCHGEVIKAYLEKCLTQ